MWLLFSYPLVDDYFFRLVFVSPLYDVSSPPVISPMAVLSSTNVITLVSFLEATQS